MWLLGSKVSALMWYLSFFIFSSAKVAASDPDGAVLNRYDEVPRLQLVAERPAFTARGPAAEEGAAAIAPDIFGNEAGMRVAPDWLFRYVEGRDPVPANMDASEIAAQLQDPFGRLLAGAQEAPENLTDVLGLFDSPGIPKPRLDDQTVYIVSESGQITLAQAPGLIRRARAVIVRRDGTARQVVFIAPSMRDNSTLELMGWDATKNRFNYYERRFEGAAGSEQAVWLWKGDSAHSWNDATRDSACFQCHRNGEPVMKELRVPWQHWHSQNAVIKSESIPDDSPLKTNPLFSINPPSPFLRKAEDLELIVKQWISNTNVARIQAFESGEISARLLLEPFLRTTTINLQPSQDPSRATGPAVRLPLTFFYNSQGLVDAAELLCDEIDAFGGTGPNLASARYRKLLEELNFELSQGNNYRERPGDTFFAFQVPEAPTTDTDLIFQVVQAGLISKRLAATLLLIDVPNPVYSPVRQALFETLPGWNRADIGTAGLEAKLIEHFGKVRQNPAQPKAVHEALRQFFALWERPEASWEADACARLEGYMRRVGERWQAQEYEDYFRLLGARREAFAASDHGSLIESELLFPKSDTKRGLVMYPDGSVAPSEF